MAKILAVDPGDKRIGIAISDPTGTIANPLKVIDHVSRDADAAILVKIAIEHAVEIIVVGCPFDADGNIGPQARKVMRFADAIRTQTHLPVVLWDESESTQEARLARIALGVKRARRAGHLDDLAAAVILQSYLDNQKK